MALILMSAVIICVALGYIIYYIAPAVKNILDIYKAARAASHIPCPYRKIHWLCGNTLEHPGQNEAGLMENIKFLEDHPKCYLFYYSSMYAAVTVNHPDTVKQILKSSAPKNKLFPGVFYFSMPWIGDSLVAISGKKWLRNRRLLMPAFHFDILKGYLNIFNQCSEQLLDKFSQCSECGDSIEVFYPASLCTLDIILKCAFSYTDNVQDSKKLPYVDAVMSLSHLLIERIFAPLHYLDFFYYRSAKGKQFKQSCELTNHVAEQVIKSRHQALLEVGRENFLTSRKNLDFLDVLLLAQDEDGQGLTEKEIRDEVQTFMFAGHDTTKSAISFALYNLARHPVYQRKAQKEIDALLEGRESDDIMWDDLSKMPYLTQCIKESMRLHAVLPVVFRRLDEPLQIGEYTVPANIQIDISIWNIHHNPTVWGKDHMTYDPERFSAENVAKMDPYAFIPFSAGARNCIGQNFAMHEIKAITSRVLHRFDMSVDDTVKMELVPDIVLSPANGMYLYFKKRH